jgi:hypothetical protein
VVVLARGTAGEQPRRGIMVRGTGHIAKKCARLVPGRKGNHSLAELAQRADALGAWARKRLGRRKLVHGNGTSGG